MLLHGLSSEQPGIEHCRTVVQELDEAKARPSRSLTSAAQEEASEASGGPAPGDSGLAPGDGAD